MYSHDSSHGNGTATVPCDLCRGGCFAAVVDPAVVKRQGLNPTALNPVPKPYIHWP